jgi:hypothetical protein
VAQYEVTKHGQFELRGPYFDGSFAVVERRDGGLYSRGLFQHRADALAKIETLNRAAQVQA